MKSKNTNYKSFALATGLVFFVPSVGTIAVAAGGAIIIGGAVVTTTWIVKAVKNFVNKEDNWTTD